MKIAVNSRLYAYTKTGVQRYIENTYKSLAKNHPELDIVYFQTTKTKSLGRTITMPTFLGLLTPFDFFLVIFLIFILITFKFIFPFMLIIILFNFLFL